MSRFIFAIALSFLLVAPGGVASQEGDAATYAKQAQAAAARGDVKTQLDLLRKASEAAPDNAGYLSAYIRLLWQRDPAAARARSLQMADRFPSDPATSQVLSELAARSSDVTEKVALLERVKRAWPGSLDQSVMRALFDAYVMSDPAKGLALAKEMVSKSPSGPYAKRWTEAIDSANALIRARSLLAAKQFGAALAIANPVINAPSARIMASLGLPDAAVNELTLLAAEAEAGQGQGEGAYDRMMTIFLQQPQDRFRAALGQYAATLGKSPSAIDDDVRARLVAKATPASDFPILTYPDGRQGSLSDLRGKVVLLNFWFPTWGGCREEFPYLQRITEKYRDAGLVVLAVNTSPGQDPMVVPFITSSGYTFTAVKDADGAIQKAYKVSVNPANFLIDRDGRIISEPILGNDEQERWLGAWIEMLLGRKDKT